MRRQPRVGPLLALCVLALVVGCAGHSARTQDARSALDASRPKHAVELYNELLEVDSEKELPKDTSGDNALLLLDRSVVLQQLGEYELSARDLQTADKQVEMLDFSRSTTDEIGRYLFSDDTGPYKSPPYEKLMINTMNMVNYLARGDLSGARVEARRFAVMQKYLSESETEKEGLLGPGSYLAGFIFEKSGDAQSAMRYYDEALASGEFVTLDPVVRRLAASSSYRTPRLTKLIDSGDATPPAEANDDAEVLVVISFGRVPAKVAKRVPIGLALTYASGSLSHADRDQANRMAAQGLVTWVNFPELERPKRYPGAPEFSLNAKGQPLDGVPVDRLTVEAWNRGKGAVIASAIVRMISRVLAGKAAEKAGGEGGVGLLLNLATQATMTAADTPDTRSWSTLPGRIALGRVRVPAGTHTVRLAARGQVIERKLELAPRGWAALNLTVLR